MGLLKTHTGPFQRFGANFNSLFDSDHFLGRNALDANKAGDTPADVQYNGSFLTVEVALPGFSKDEIKVAVDNYQIHISAERQTDENVYQLEEIPKKINKYFPLTTHMHQEKIDAALENGVLRLTIPYVDMAKKANRTIEVH